jgi:ATP-dependent helicase HrpB
VAGLFDETNGGILAFLPGAAEIRRVGGRLAAALGPRAEVLPLHGTMRLEDQRRVILPPEPGSRRRLVLATSIAETSLTVPGISAIADSGWARLTRFHPATGLDRFDGKESASSGAARREGRPAQRCVRFWRTERPRANDPRSCAPTSRPGSMRPVEPRRGALA